MCLIKVAETTVVRRDVNVKFQTCFLDRSPLWRGGGVVHGPRAFTTEFYMLPFVKRLRGLTSTLSAKFAQVSMEREVHITLYSFVSCSCHS